MTRLQALSPRRLVAVWRAASTFIGASTARVAAISVLSLLRGLAEAAVLVVVARVALALSDGDERLGLDLGPFGVKTLTISQALGAAVVAAICMLLLHLIVSELSARMSSEALATAVYGCPAHFSRALGAFSPLSGKDTSRTSSQPTPTR